jgi:AraC-like DNA-binding protein
MSRSAFAARFMSLVEESPMLYLRRWRMQVALTRLKTEDIPIAELGEELGYQSEAAFNRAFKKTMGTTPGAVRRQARKAAA